MALIRRQNRHSGTKWRTFGVAVFAALSTIASGTAATAAPLSQPSPVAHGAGGQGTIAAKNAGNGKTIIRHSVSAASADSTGALSTISSVTVNGGYTAAGIGMRNLGYGSISVTGVPAGATVASATLLWDILADQSDPTFAQGSLNGTPITGTNWASGASPCWSPGSNFSYEADVTSLVNGNGSYALAGFASGESDGADPWNSGSTPPMLEGATLVVVYKMASMPTATIQIAAGASETASGNEALATMTGFTTPAEPSATTTYIVADGQEAGNTAEFNGTALPGVGFPGADPQAVAGYSQGDLWDTVTTDVSDLVNPGDTSATLGLTGNDDCLVWVGQVFEMSGTGSVLGLGDSVAAGYGLGPSQGFPDNPAAYPAVLGQDLGGSPGQNYAIEGACASTTDGCTSSVDQEIRQVPSSFKPSLITLTVGADDINFAGCIESIIVNSDLSMTASGDPCNHTRLSASLTAFQRSLSADLQTLSVTYPGVPVDVMDYYNPFPAPPGSHGTACVLNDGVGLLYEHAQTKSWAKTVEMYLRHPTKFEDNARLVQKRIYDDAQSVLSQLNSTINTVARADGSTVVNAGDFAGHDMCQKGAAKWVFEPTLAVNMSLRAGAFHKTTGFSTGGQVCPDPIKSAEWDLTISKSFDSKSLHASGSFYLRLGLNCAPHPDTNGQTALARDFLQQSGL